MLATFDLAGQAVDSLDLKCLLLGAGMGYPARVYDAVAGRARLAPPSNPYACNCVILPGEVAVHLMPNDSSPFALDLDSNGQVCLFHKGERLTEVTFPPATDYYRQCTGKGRPFGSYAVLEGAGLMAFFYMWPCEYIRTKGDLRVLLPGSCRKWRASTVCAQPDGRSRRLPRSSLGELITRACGKCSSPRGRSSSAATSAVGMLGY